MSGEIVTEPEGQTVPAQGGAAPVLVVAEDPQRREWLSGLLGTRWPVRSVADVDSALEAIRQAQPELVVSEVGLPSPGGIGLVRELLADPPRHEVPVMLVAGEHERSRVSEAFAAGAVDFLAEPIDPEELLAHADARIQLRRSRRRLTAHAALLAAQISSAPQAILAVSPDRRVLAFNRHFEELWKLPAGTVAVGGPSPAFMEKCRLQVRDPVTFEAALRWGHEHPDEMQHLDVPLVDGRVIEGISAPIVDEVGLYRGRIWFLSDDTERRRVEAERTALLEQLQAAQRSQTFLLSAADALARASGFDETVRRLAAVAVPTLGDICLIDILDEDGTTRRAAARHADPLQQPLVDELGRRYPPDPEGAHPSVAAMRNRQSHWSSSMPDDFLRSTTRDSRHYSLVKQLHFTSYMTVPLIHEDVVLGTITLICGTSGRRLNPSDLSLAEALARQVAAVVAKARRQDQDREAAHKLQASLLPANLPQVPGLMVAVRYLPGTRYAEVGGDWYDLMPMPSGAVALAVGDVAGHDIDAAAAMGAVRSACRALIAHSDSPQGLLDLLHSGWDRLGVERVATCVVARLDPRSRLLKVASAGHPPPLVVTDTDARFLPVEPGPPLGAPDAAGTEYETVLDPGSIVLFYTDGLIEDRDDPLDAGMNRLLEVAANGPKHPEALCERVLTAMGRDRFDDVAVLAAALR